MSAPEHAPPEVRAWRRDRAVLGLAMVAAVTAVLLLIGWASNAPLLTIAGIGGVPVWPIIAAGLVLAAAGLVVPALRQSRAAVWIALPLAIALPGLPVIIAELAGFATPAVALVVALCAVLNTLLLVAVAMIARARSRAVLDRSATESLWEQQELLGAEDQLHEIGVLAWDVASGAFRWSLGAEQRLGIPAGSMATFDDWRSSTHPEDVAAVLATIERAIAERQDRFTFQYRFMRADEAPRVIEGYSRCVYDADGALVRTVSSMLDVTERITREAEVRLESIMETVPDATVVIDAKGRIRSFSKVAETMFGYGADETIGNNVKMLMPDWVAAGHDASIARYFETGERKVIGKTRELTARHANGSFFPIELNVGEAMIGKDVIFTGIIRNVSDRLSSERRMSDLSNELAHVSRQSAMSELAGDLAHELNQPLSATANFLGAARMLIAQGEHGERVAELLQMGEEQTLRSGDIIRRLRDFLVRRDMEMRPESLGDVVRSAVELVLFGVARSDVTLAYDLDPAADAILVDRIQIQQVLVNLLRNATDVLRSLPPADLKQITIKSRPSSDDMVEVMLSDSGPGIPDEVIKRLYDRFATTKSGDAMGIGLSISRRIVETHGGKLTAGNQPGGGAVFCFTLPAMKDLDDDA